MCDEAYEVGYKEGQMDMRRKMSGNSEFSQAQIAQLQAKNDQLGNIIDDRNLRIRKLQTQVAQLVEALEFYLEISRESARDIERELTALEAAKGGE